jgi:hypothetical protein
MQQPMTCTLTEAELRERRSAILDGIRHSVGDVAALPDGFVYTFPTAPDTLTRLAQLVDLERQCCRFLTFRIVAEPDNGPIRLEITGPPGTREMIAEYFGGSNS